MTAITRNPINQNFIHPNKFQLNFARCPNLQFFCQSVSVPGISMSEIVQNTPFTDLYIPGEKPIYDLLNVTFYVDEDLKSWIEMHDWIRAMTFPTNYGEYRNLSKLNPNAISKPQYSSASLTLLSSANNPNIVFDFVDVFPISLSTFIVSATDSPDSTITADVTFRYSYYNIRPAG